MGGALLLGRVRHRLQIQGGLVVVLDAVSAVATRRITGPGVRRSTGFSATAAAPAAIGATQPGAGNGSETDEQPTLNLQSVPGTSQ